MDNVHKPLSTTIVDNCTTRPALGSYSYMTESRLWAREEGLERVISTINKWAALQGDTLLNHSENIGLSELLYGIETLRKRGQDEQT